MSDAPSESLGRGGGGTKGQSAPRPPNEAPNTLQSRATGFIMDVLGEGPIEGFANGMKSVFFNDTALQNQDDSYNFKGVNLALMAGLPDQAPLNGFEETGTTRGVGIKVTVAGGPLVRTVNTSPLSAVRVTIRIPALLQQDTTTGDLNPTQVALSVEIQPNGGAWQQAVSKVISGKCTSPYEESYRIPLTGSAPWNIRVTRLTPDSTATSLVNDLYWASYTELLDWPLIYPDTAYVGMSLDSELFGGSVPTRAYEVKGLKIQVPVNYDPITRSYSGLWNGTFKIAWTNNPAWVFYDLLTNPRYGLGQDIPAGQIDKWTLYQIAQYCDEAVPDGNGGTEPRFVFNGVLNTSEDAYSVLQTIAASFRGMAYFGSGLITATQDAPAQPVKLVTNANVVDGQFIYEGTARRARHTLARVMFSDAANNYRPSVEPVESPDIASRGMLPIDIVAVGTTSRTQARRIGKWLLDSERSETETVSYRAGLDHADLRPGDIILVADRWYAGVRMGGRVVSATTTSVQIDAPFTFEGGQTYTLRVTLPNNQVQDLPVNVGASTSTNIVVTGSFSAVPNTESVWLITASNRAPRPFRVISVGQAEDGTMFDVIALFHDATKYDRVELGINRPPPPFSPTFNGTVLPPPSSITAEEYIGGVADTAQLRVLVSWTPPMDPRVESYEVRAVQGGYILQQHEVKGTSYEFRDLQPGSTIFQARSVGSSAVSAWVSSDAIVVDGRADDPAPPTDLAAAGGIRQNVVTWTTPTGRHYRTTEVWASSTATFSAGGKIGESDRGQFIHTGLMPNTTRWYWVRAADAFGQFSAWVGPVSATTSLLVAADITDGILDTAKFAAGIKPVAVPATNGALATLRTTDQIIYPQVNLTDSTTAQALDAQRLYRWNGSQWVAVVSAAEISGQITSDQIAALAATKVTGQITQTQITDGAISTPKLAAGAVTTATLAAGAVTTNKLAVVPQTLNVDPYFQDASAWFFPAFGSGWYAENAAPGNATSNLGVPRAGVLFDGNWTGTGESAVVSTFTIPVTVGERLAVKARGVNFGNKTVYASINYHNAAGAYLSSLGVEWVPGTWVSDKETQGVVPANAAYAHVVLYVGSGAAWSGWAAISAVTVFRPATASMVVDGAITADKIAANAITSDKLAANSIVAGKIAAGAISSSQIAAGEIRAVNLASETLITQAGQLGSAVIGTAQIQDLSVGTLKVANNAISETVGGTWGGSWDAGSFVDLVSVYFWGGETQRYLILTSLLGTGGSWFDTSGESSIFRTAGFSMRLLLNGGNIYEFSSNATGTIFYGQMLFLGAGGYELKLQGRVFEPQPGGIGTLNNAFISVTKVKK